MYIETILFILSIATIFGLVTYFIFGLTKEIRDFNNYVNSIQVGDVFDLNNKSTLIENPFERDKAFEYTFDKCVVTDIKTDQFGTKWVKYKCLKSNEERSEKLTLFIEDYTRIKKLEENK